MTENLSSSVSASLKPIMICSTVVINLTTVTSAFFRCLLHSLHVMTKGKDGEMVVSYITTWSHNPQDCNLNLHHHGNLKSCKFKNAETLNFSNSNNL